MFLREDTSKPPLSLLVINLGPEITLLKVSDSISSQNSRLSISSQNSRLYIRPYNTKVHVVLNLFIYRSIKLAGSAGQSNIEIDKTYIDNIDNKDRDKHYNRKCYKKKKDKSL